MSVQPQTYPGGTGEAGREGRSLSTQWVSLGWVDPTKAWEAAGAAECVAGPASGRWGEKGNAAGRKTGGQRKWMAGASARATSIHVL